MAEIGSPTNESLKGWWKHFTIVQRMKKTDTDKEEPHRVFGVPLRVSLSYASVQISTANQNGDLYIWGHIPVVVAKCGLYLKEHATEVEGTFRINGSNKRMRELQAVFETPPRYGKTLDWKQEQYNTHDVASVFRRFLTQMPEPVIPYELYHGFRDALAKKPFVQEEVIATYKKLIRSMPRGNQYLLLYVLDLLSVFARKSDKNLMTATNLAVIFRPGIISHPTHEMAPEQHRLSQQVLEFLIAHQDWFMLDIPPTSPTSPTSPAMDVYTDPDPAAVVDDDWKLVEKGKVRAPFLRRRTFSERGMREEGLTPHPATAVNAHNILGAVLESTTPTQQAAHVRCVDTHVPTREREQAGGGTTGLSRSRTMPSWRRSIGGGTALGDVANRVLKKRPGNLRRDSHKT